MIILILGDTGSGKTSLGVSFGIKAMDNGEESVEMCRDRLSAYSGYSKVEIPSEHLVYSDIFMHGSEVNNTERTAHFTTGYRFGLPNEDFETDYFPYGSTIIFDEARKYWSARKSMLPYDKGGTHEKTFEAFELHRQNGLTIIMVTQLLTHIDNNIRSLAHIVIEPLEIIQERVGKVLKHDITKWKCRVYGSCDEYEQFKKGDKSIKVEETEYTFNGDIFECYDSEFFMFKFIHGLKKYSCIKLKPCDGTKQSVKKLYELYSDLRTNYKKKREELKNASKEPGRIAATYL